MPAQRWVCMRNANYKCLPANGHGNGRGGCNLCVEPGPLADLCFALLPQVIYTVTDIPAFQVGGRFGNDLASAA